MKGRILVLQQNPARAALVVDGRVEDLLIEPPGDARPPMPGEIWQARIVRKVPNQPAAFVALDGGGGGDGYLRDARGLAPGDTVPVQVTGVAETGKSVPVDQSVLIRGRRLILTPGRPGVNVSRQIRDPEEQERLRATIAAPGDDVGVIVRSAARDADAGELVAELALLAGRLERIADAGVAERWSPITHALREWGDPLPDVIAAPDPLADWLASPDGEAQFFEDRDLRDLLRGGEGDPFDHFGVWDEIERLRSPRADLPSGGWMSVEATRALVAVDVNTADQFSGGAAMTTNIEAARELPRQLRLRGLGGQVIVDFAPMKKMHRRKIDEVLKAAFRRDPIDTTLAGWTPLGNFELQRKRERRPLATLIAG